MTYQKCSSLRVFINIRSCIYHSFYYFILMIDHQCKIVKRRIYAWPNINKQSKTASFPSSSQRKSEQYTILCSEKNVLSNLPMSSITTLFIIKSQLVPHFSAARYDAFSSTSLTHFSVGSSSRVVLMDRRTRVLMMICGRRSCWPMIKSG